MALEGLKKKRMKAAKFYISKPIDSTWPELGKNLRDAQYQSAKALNHCMTTLYLWQIEKEEIKKQTGKYPAAKEFPMPNKQMYHEIRAMFPEIASRSMSSIVQKATQRWKTDVKDCFYRQNKSLPTFKKNHPAFISNQQFNLESVNGEIRFSFTLFSRKTERQQKYTVQLNTKKVTGSQRAILDRIISGRYKKRDAQIGYHERKNKWFVTLVYSPEKSDMPLDKERIVGIDLGVKFTFYAAVSGSKDRLYAFGEEVENFRKKIRHRRKSMSRGGTFSARKGRGRRVMLEPVLRIGDSERRFRDTKYHQYTAKIIEFAIKHRAGVIQLENLDGLKSAKVGHFVLNDWAISALHEKLQYKADQAGIEVRFVNPQYTSQRCFKCGFIDRGNRPDQEAFRCLSCGFEENADRNAALNLTLPDIENAILRTLSEQDASKGFSETGNT